MSFKWVVMGPRWLIMGIMGAAPVYGTRPKVGLRPKRSQYEPGMRTEPAWSLPIASSAVSPVISGLSGWSA